MSTEQEVDGTGVSGKENVAIALGGLLDKLFSATLVGPALSQIGLTIGDQVKLFRIKNLMSLNKRLEQALMKRNLDKDDLQKLSLSVGFPLLEKASYQDDEFLQEKWANLLASAMGKKEEYRDTTFSLDITYVEILHQFSRLDCEVLEYIVENGVDGRSKNGALQVVGLDPLDIRNAFPDSLTHISLEKLVTLGCAYRILRLPLDSRKNDGYGAWAQDIIVTMIGLNLYVSASGRQPRWSDMYIENDEAADNTKPSTEQ